MGQGKFEEGPPFLALHPRMPPTPLKCGLSGVRLFPSGAAWATTWLVIPPPLVSVLGVGRGWLGVLGHPCPPAGHSRAYGGRLGCYQEQSLWCWAPRRSCSLLSLTGEWGDGGVRPQERFHVVTFATRCDDDVSGMSTNNSSNGNPRNPPGGGRALLPTVPQNPHLGAITWAPDSSIGLLWIQ